MTYDEIIPKPILDVLEESFRVNGYIKCGTEYCFEIEGTTDAQGDMIHTLQIGEDKVDDLQTWVEAYRREVDYFDPWEEAHKWLDDEGRPAPRKTPFDNGYDLYQDIVAYKDDMLWPVYLELCKAFATAGN